MIDEDILSAWNRVDDTAEDLWSLSGKERSEVREELARCAEELAQVAQELRRIARSD